jgi:isohexenylglutaconyl-CoA hydratase
MSEPALLVEARGAFLHVTFNRPHSRNALTDEMVEGLAAAVDQAAASPQLRALVIQGSGAPGKRSFSAGGDFSGFKALMAQAPPDGQAGTAQDPIAVFNRRFGAMLQKLAACPVATVAVVEGAAMGGGLGIAATCDFVLAAHDAQFAMPEVTLGLPPAQIAPFVARRLGEGAALRLMLTGRKINGDDAAQLGLVDLLTDDLEDTDQDHTAALALLLDGLCKQLMRAEPAALRATKAILTKGREAPLAGTLDVAATHFARALRSGAAAEGMAAVAAKRPPGWASGA